MFTFLRRARKHRVQTECTKLVIHAGEFQVTERGVKSQFRPPLSRLSGHYSWTAIPVGIAAMKLLVVGTGSGESIGKLLHRFRITSAELDMFDQAIGTVWKSSLVDRPLTVDHQLEWLDLLLDVCTGAKWSGKIVLEDRNDLVPAPDNPWLQSVDELIDWCNVLVNQCPYHSASYDLAQLGRMNDGQLEQYVMKYLG